MNVNWTVVEIKSKVSSIGYVNRTGDNLLSIEKSSVLPFFEDLKAVDCVVCSGSG
jgi:hypothetical protein